ncbi:MAG: DUF4407 domain-containing protein [Lewinellaceae bacterium]|nr:DUF4407 domain-containing protein [Lewinellaceae bacterium]
MPGYAFYTIFEPRGSAIEQQFSLPVMIMSFAFGIIWGLMIFNIDRFIVTSTGKGDGTEAITWEEFKGAIPRIIMGAIIALTISKPVEIRMFKTEIDVKLYERQLEAEKKFKEYATENYEDRVKLADDDLAKVENQRNQLQELLLETTRKFNDVANKTVIKYRSRTDDEGNIITYKYEVPHPSIKSYQSQIDKISNQLAEFDKNNAEKLRKIEKYRDQLLSEKENVLGNNKQVAASLDGLLERIHLAHEVAGFWITLFITLLFMAIELTPIFFKLMLIKTPYDYIEENIKELIKAEQGIYVLYNYYKDKEGQERDLVKHLNVDKVIDAQKDARDIERKLALYALEQYEQTMKRRIDMDPEAFVKLNDQKTNGG